MNRTRVLCGVLVALLMSAPAFAWQALAGPPRGFHPYQGQGKGAPDWRGPAGGHGQRRPHIGQWLRKNQNLPMDQQERALRSDPEFQKLPSQQQQHLIERLHEFNNLPPQKRERMLARMDTFEHLSPEQQHQARQIFGQVRQMPPERREQFRKGIRQLADAPAEQRTGMLDSQDFQNNYTDNERGLMRQIVQLNILPPKAAPEPPAGPPPDKR